jgi:hypothetical protein
MFSHVVRLMVETEQISEIMVLMFNYETFVEIRRPFPSHSLICVGCFGLLLPVCNLSYAV